jgi:TolB protein
MMESDIYIVDFHHPKPRKLVSGANPVWSPDGERIAFCIRNGAEFKQLQVMNADGSGRRELTQIKGGACHPDWSPDGGKIAFTVYTGKKTTIFVVGVTGGDPAQITEGYAARWSHDGTMLLFLRGQEYGGGDHFLWMAHADGSGAKMLMPVDPSTRDVNWLPNGRGIFFSSNRSAHQVIFRTNFDGTEFGASGNEQLLNWISPAISPDCKQLVVNERSISLAGFGRFNAGDVVLIDLESGRKTKLAEGMEPSIVWSGR